MDPLRLFNKVYYQSVINHACTQLWEGESKSCIKWTRQICEAKQAYKVPQDLSHKVKLCFLVAQLHLYVLHIKRGSAEKWDPERFIKSFDKACQFFPFSKVEIQCMKQKITEWFLKKDITVSDCLGYINEIKEFFEPLYKKLHEPTLNEVYKIFEKKASSGMQPSSSALKKTFLWSYNGSKEEGLKEWNEIINDTHEDVVHLKQKMARKQQSTQQNVEKNNPDVPLGFLPGFKVQLVDFITSLECKNKLSANMSTSKLSHDGQSRLSDSKNINHDSEKGKEPVDSSRNQKHSTKNLKRLHDASDTDNSDTETDQVSPSYELSGNFDKTSIKSFVFNKTKQSSTDRGEPSSLNAKDNVSKKAVRNSRTTPLKKKLEMVIHRVDENSDDTKEQGPDSETQNTHDDQEHGNIQRVVHEAVSDHHSEQAQHDNEVATNKNKSLKDGAVASTSKHAANELIQNARVVSTNLSKATETLMSIVKDPYRRNNSSDTEDDNPADEPQSKTCAIQQKDTVQPEWGDSDDDFEDTNVNKIVLKSITKNRGLLQFVKGNDDNSANKEFFAEKPATKRKKKRYWTPDEMDWLREGIKKHGIGNWAVIREQFPFVNRTSVDIKDKYRNMVKNAEL